jgi:hypothetical protein
MRISLLVIIILFVSARCYSQNDSLLIKQCITFHQKLVAGDVALKDYLDDNLTYGHSSGWIESKHDMLADLQSGKIKYNSIKEDSIVAAVDESVGYVRYKADMDVALDGKQIVIRLKVLEVWRKKDGVWKLFARQAIRV